MSDDYGYCNSCGEEMWEGDDCCDDGEWVPAEDREPQPEDGPDYHQDHAAWERRQPSPSAASTEGSE